MNKMKMALVVKKKMGKKIDGQTSTPANLLMGKVPDRHCSDGNSS